MLTKTEAQLYGQKVVDAWLQGDRVLLMSGGGETGNTMVAHSAWQMVPPLSPKQQTAVFDLYRQAGMTPQIPPFRAPHYSISYEGMFSRSPPEAHPGEEQLAEHGVLYLDAFPYYNAIVLQTLLNNTEAADDYYLVAGSDLDYETVAKTKGLLDDVFGTVIHLITDRDRKWLSRAILMYDKAHGMSATPIVDDDFFARYIQYNGWNRLCDVLTWAALGATSERDVERYTYLLEKTGCETGPKSAPRRAAPPTEEDLDEKKRMARFFKSAPALPKGYTGGGFMGLDIWDKRRRRR